MKKTLLIFACALVLSAAADSRGDFMDRETQVGSLGLQIQNPKMARLVRKVSEYREIQKASRR